MLFLLVWRMSMVDRRFVVGGRFFFLLPTFLSLPVKYMFVLFPFCFSILVFMFFIVYFCPWPF
jgi:hypothetical protein